jgi:hypothetical protein
LQFAIKAKLEKISFEQNHDHIDTQTLMDILIEASQEVVALWFHTHVMIWIKDKGS